MSDITLFTPVYTDSGNETDGGNLDWYSGAWGAHYASLREPFARFTGVLIPGNATIVSAKLSLNNKSNYYGDVQVNSKIYGILEANTPTFSNANKPAQRGKTVASVDWDVAEDEHYDVGAWYESLDIAAIIQEIIGQGGWASGNALALSVLDDGTPQDRYQHRLFLTRAYSAVLCPRLEVSYTVPSSPDRINRKCSTGRMAFIGQYIKHRVHDTAPWKLPTGEPF